ncbi:MAG: hypothetical protein M1831_001282 [Alyxoria varia]|nr:MAG: hypothetical protein M1831_001282 [Alyxoria varia]
MGEGTTPDNYSLPMQPVFELVGPSNDPYPDLGFCLPQVSPPKNLTVKDGDNATIQVVMNAKHGAALFSCVDITFTDNMDLVAPINESNCHNDSRLSFGTVFTTTGLSSAATPTIFKAPRLIGALGAAIFTSAIWLTL